MSDKEEKDSLADSLKQNIQEQIEFFQQGTKTEIKKLDQTSDFLDAYLDYIGKKLDEQQIKQLHKKIRGNNVTIDQNNFQSTLQLEIIETDFQSYVIFLHYGIYKIKIKVLMTELADHFFPSSVISSGSFGSIYSVERSQMSYAVKRIHFFNENNLDQDLQKVYIQYFLCSLASLLKVGPKIFNIFGYDIIVTKNSAFFVMELCQNYTRLKNEEVKRTCIENLRVLHSLKFIHLDIKPANLAYSPFFKKCVFIDFGLSQLIKEDIGFKTFTNFVGTLTYCSEEMRKTYILKKPKFIDLYHNDSVSLKNTLNKIQFHYNVYKIQDLYEAEYSQNSIELSIIQESVIILQMKYHIFFNNIELVKKNVTKFIEWPRSFYGILNSKAAHRMIIKNETIKDHITNVKNIISQTKIVVNIADNIIGEAFEKSNEQQGASKFTVSHQILNLTREQFEIILKSQEFLYNIILYMDEFSKEDQKNQQKQKIILKLFKKVVDVKNEGLTEIYEQIDYFLNHLNRNLRKNRNYKSLSVLRMLYIRMDDFKSIQLLEDEIIDLIQSPVLKCLKISQFLLFWSLIFNRLKYYKIDSWMKIIQKLKDSEQNNPLFMKIKQFSLTLLQYINQRYYDFNDIENLVKVIEECLSDPQLKEFHEQIFLVKCMYEQYERLQNKCLENSQMLQICRVSFPYLGFSENLEEKTFFKVFESCERYLKRHNFMENPERSKMQIQNCVNYVLNKFRGRPDLISPTFFEYINSSIKSNKSVALLFLTKFVENMQILSKQFTLFCQYQMSFTENCIRKFLLVYSELRQKKENGLNDDELNTFIEKIKELKLLCNQKLNLSIQKNNLSQIHNLVVVQKVIEIKYLVIKRQILEIEKKIEQLFEQLNLPSYQNDTILLTFCELIEQIVPAFSKKIEKKYENLVVRICQNYIKQKEASVLENGLYTAQNYLRINIKRNQIQKSRMFIERMISQLEEQHIRMKIKYVPEYSLSHYCRFFCLNADISLLKNVYSQISFKKEQFQRNCFPFYVLSIFHALYLKCKLEKQIAQRQLKRSCLCLTLMSPFHNILSKKIILSFCDLIVQKKRKKVICCRLQMRYPIQQKRHIILNNHFLKSEVKFIKKNKIKQYLLRKKIFRINF